MGLFGKSKKEVFKKTEPVMDPQDPSLQQQEQQPSFPQAQGFEQPVEEEKYVYQPSANIPQAPVQQQYQQQAKVEPVWSVKEIATQTEPVVYNSVNKKAYTIIQAIVEILNRSEY